MTVAPTRLTPEAIVHVAHTAINDWQGHAARSGLPASGMAAEDWFCGAGGMTLAWRLLGGETTRALNHWHRAIDSHAANHPDAEHVHTDVCAVDPRYFAADADILVATPECRYFSQARGRPQSTADLFNPHDEAGDRSRALMWDVPRAAAARQLQGRPYLAVLVENVPEVVTYPRAQDAPRGVKPGDYFREWLEEMDKLGYDHRVLFLNSMFFGAPQSRDRCYIAFWLKKIPAPDLKFEALAWCNACQKLVDATQRHKRTGAPADRAVRVKYGRQGQYLYHCPDCGQEAVPAVTPAAEAINWGLRCPRIGDRQRPLADATRGRIKRGLIKLGGQPQAVPLDRLRDHSKQTAPVTVPLATQTGRQDKALVTPAQTRVNEATDTDRPLGTLVTRERFALVTQVGGNTYERPGYARAWGAQHPLPAQTATADKALVTQVGGQVGSCRRERDTAEPLAAITSDNHKALVVSNMAHNVPRDADAEAMATVTTGAKLYLLDPALVELRGDPGRPGGPNRTKRATAEAMGTVSAQGQHHALIVRHNGSPDAPLSSQGWQKPTGEPMGTITARNGSTLVVPGVVGHMVLAYNRTATGQPATQPAPTVTSVDPHALIDTRESAPEPPDDGDLDAMIDDAGFRMLTWEELARGMWFPADYTLLGSQRDRVKLSGNAVTWPVPYAILHRIVTAIAWTAEAQP